MNVARLLQDSPSDDHRQRQELKDKFDRDREKEADEEREREREREFAREREREREWEKTREWDREREERAQRDRMSLSSFSAVPSPSRRPYSPLESSLPPRSHLHAAYESKTSSLPPSSRAPVTPHHGPNSHSYAPSPTPESLHARSYSQDSHPPPHTAGHAHSPPPPLFLSPLTAPYEETAAGPVPGPALSVASPEYPTEYAHHRAKGSSSSSSGTGTAAQAHSRHEQDRERDREYRQRAQSLTGSGRPPRTPPYGDYRDAGRISPTTSRSIPMQHSPLQSPYPSTQAPPHPHAHPQYSPPFNNNNSNSSLGRMHPSQGPPLSRRPLPPPSSLPPAPSASLKHSHDNKGPPTSSAMSRSFEEVPYLGRGAPSSSSSSSVMSSGRTLKEDLEYERATYERERELERGRERERERDRERRELQRSTRSRSASASAGMHAHPPNAYNERVVDREREFSEVQRVKDVDARGQGPPWDARERDPPRHHHHHHHHHAVPHSHSHSHSSHSPHSQHHHQQSQQQQQMQGQLMASNVPGTPYTYAHTGKPRISRSGVLKLAPPGVQVPNNVPPSSSDLVFAGASGVVIRPETLTLAPSHAPPPSHPPGHRPDGEQKLQVREQGPLSRHDSSGPQLIDPIPVGVKQPSPPTLTLHSANEIRHESSQVYQDGPKGFADGPHSIVHPHPQQHPPPLSKHKQYSGMPIGPGVPPPSSGPSPPANLHASMIAVQQQQQHQQQHAHQYLPPPPHPHPHQQSLPPPPPQPHPPSSSNGMHAPAPPPHLHSNPYQHVPPGMPPPPQHQGYPPMHYNEVRPPPVPMALQPMPAPSPPMRESTPAETPLHLGTYVYPRAPFPYFFPARVESDYLRHSSATSNISPGKKSMMRRESDLALEQRERVVHVTILVPSAHLPASLPTDGRPRVWGGAPLSIPAPWTPYINFVTRNAGARRIYTDDSDVILCALHSGRVSWNGMRRARAAGLDLSIRLALHRDVGRYIGGPSAFADGSVVEGNPDVDVGLKRLLDSKSAKEATGRTRSDDTSWLLAPTASWESGHDGSGIEVVNAEWLLRGSTRKVGLRNRSQRLHEYTERRRVVMKEITLSDSGLPSERSTTILGKRPAPLYGLSSSYKREEDLLAVRTIVFGKYGDTESAGLGRFKYTQWALRSALFPHTPPSPVSPARSQGRRKRRKLDDMDTDADNRRSPSPGRSVKSGSPRDIILENNIERFLLAQHNTIIGGEEDKENQAISTEFADKTMLAAGKGRRYDLYFLPLSSPSSSTPSTGIQTSPYFATEAGSSNGIRNDIPMTPKSNRSAPSSPTVAAAVVEHPDGVPPNANADKNASEKQLSSKSPVGKVTVIPTPPATTATEHPPSPPASRLQLLGTDVDGEGSKVPRLLFRDLGLENIQFLENGLVIKEQDVVAVGRLLDNRDAVEKDAMKGQLIRVDRWRWAGSRDNVSLQSEGSR